MGEQEHKALAGELPGTDTWRRLGRAGGMQCSAEQEREQSLEWRSEEKGAAGLLYQQSAGRSLRGWRGKQGAPRAGVLRKGDLKQVEPQRETRAGEGGAAGLRQEPPPSHPAQKPGEDPGRGCMVGIRELV